MRIAIVTAVYYPMINGVAVFSHNLALGLAARGNEVMVLCPSQKGKTYTATEDGVRVKYLRAREFKLYPDQIHAAKKGKFGYEHGFKVALRPGKEVAKALEEFRPEVVHIQVADLIGMAAARWARKNGVAVVMTEHNQPEVLVEPLGIPKFLRGAAEGVLSAAFMRRLNQGDFATMPTKEAIRNLISARGKGFKAPVAAVSNGVELGNFKPGRAKKEIYEKYGIRQGAPTILYVGRVDPEKKVNLIVEAFSRAVKTEERAVKTGGQEVKNDEWADKVDRTAAKTDERKKWQLAIVGDGVARKGLERQAREMGIEKQVRFLGRVVPPDLYELYKVGDVFATASEIETQGIVLIEAAATGLPLIAVDKGAVNEVCRDGENGILCRSGEVKEIAAAMCEILGDEKKRAKFSKKSLEIAREHDFERTLDQFLNIYRKAEKSRSSGAAR